MNEDEIEKMAKRREQGAKELERFLVKFRQVWFDAASFAWGQGRTNYQPVLQIFSPAFIGPNRNYLTPNDDFAEEALDAIMSVGWKLHTWTVNSPDEDGKICARPLFVRSGEE